MNKFRKKLQNADLIEGAFINFVDKDLGPDPKTARGRYKLLKFYYGKNLDKLITIKKELDPDNLFNFQMSIPSEKPY